MWSEVQLEPRAPSRDLAKALPIFRTEIFFQCFFLHRKINIELIKPCKFGFSHTHTHTQRERERERERESYLSDQSAEIYMFNFVQGIQKIYKLLTLH